MPFHFLCCSQCFSIVLKQPIKLFTACEKGTGERWLPHCNKESSLNLRSQENPNRHETNESHYEWKRHFTCLAADVLTRCWVLGKSEANIVKQQWQPSVSSLVKTFSVNLTFGCPSGNLTQVYFNSSFSFSPFFSAMENNLATWT